MSAWLQLKMLMGEPAPAIGGSGIVLQAQVSALGWHIDDLLMTSQASGQAERRLAMSAKGNLQVTSAGLPADFVHRAWQQWRAPKSPMNRTNDGLALVTQQLHRDFHPAWTEVKNACSGGDVALAISRIRQNQRQSRIFDSVRKPNSDVPEATDEETVELIRHLHVLPVDFQLAHSELRNQAIAQCRQLLASRDASEAEVLWQYLINSAAEVRLRRGTLTLEELWSLLRPRFGLRLHPDFAHDWDTLAILTADYKVRVETELPTGHSILRSEERAKLEVAISANTATVVFGESGAGKSALVKNVLDERFSDRTQVWFGPDQLKTALSALLRSTLPIQHELGRVLKASANRNNILVLDSAERIEPSEFGVIRQLIQSLLPPGTRSEDAPWRIIVITQTQSWAEGAEAMLGGRQARLVEIEPLSSSEVKTALLASSSLSWLIGHDDTIAQLMNLRTLAWVVQAGPALGSSASGLTSHTAIADRLWVYWTSGAPDIQALMMRLAKREASFERSFALTGLDPVDSSTFTRRPKQLPLRLNSRTNCVEFEHDLAADWARFQFLKQIAHDTPQWAELAKNPLWANALRMLGQFLLRQPTGSGTAWDDAFEGTETAKLGPANDILLDAICLDSDAQRHLSDRVVLLLADHGKRLTRLLTRFNHIGTVPNGGVWGTASLLGLYMEVQYRSVIFGRWPPILRFLISNRDKIGGLVLSTTAVTWLNGTPQQLSDGTPFPFRRELTQIALAIARTVQVEKGLGTIYATRESELYMAPLAGAADLPDEVASWALELTGRQEIAADVTRRIADGRRLQAEAHALRLETDPEYRDRHEKRYREPRSMGFGRQKLPPWSLGARRRVDHDFRKACLTRNALTPLMRARPNIAAEVLLALIVEDDPHLEYGSSRSEINLGLVFAQEAYPTAFWKSPFFSFLQIMPHVALRALIALVNFCTERWGAEVMHDRTGPPPGITLRLAEGDSKAFVGGPRLFDWTQESSLHHGNLHCALDALERWLTLQLDVGADITSHIDQMLRESSSVAFLGLLVNVGKYRPSLFSSTLRPLLSEPHLFYWDNWRSKTIQDKFIAWSWAQAGEELFELAKSWALASHRRRTMLEVATELLKADEAMAHHFKALIPTWILPDDPKEALEFKLIFAELNRDNYEWKRDAEARSEILVLNYPAALRHEVQQWQDLHEKPLQYLLLPSQLDKLLQTSQTVSDETAAQLYGFLQSCKSDSEIEPDVKRKCELALAAALIVSAGPWLSKAPEAQKLAIAIVREAVLESGGTAEAIRSNRIGASSDDLKFAAYAVMNFWMNHERDSTDWESLVLRLLTSGNDWAASTIFRLAYVNRANLTFAWWRLLQVGVFWSGLVLLSPQYGDEQHVEQIWHHWLTRLRRFSLRRNGVSASDLKLERVAKACERLEYDRQLRAYNSGDRRWRGKPTRRSGIELDTHFLGIVFDWAINGTGAGNWIEDSQLVGRLWAYEAGRAKARSKDKGEYDLPSDRFGYDILIKLADLALAAPMGQARTVWEPVLSHGPEAHYALQHFAIGLFLSLSKGHVLDGFEPVWREIVEYGLDAKWDEKYGHWFHGARILCDLLGFGHERTLQALPSGAALRMRDVYERWASNHMKRSEECVTRFCNFLTSDFGAPLRLDGLRWIAAMLTASTRSSEWHRDGTGDALIHLLDTSLNQNSKELVRNTAAREALVELAADLAGRGLRAAFALQERIKLLR